MVGRLHRGQGRGTDISASWQTGCWKNTHGWLINTIIELEYLLMVAECVAEFTQRPLLAITPGDIGTEPKTVEWELNRFFRLGEQWGTILLLDEADVYLESRNNRDLTRNSLVSGSFVFGRRCYLQLITTTVFLRALEYYQGSVLSA